MCGGKFTPISERTSVGIGPPRFSQETSGGCRKGAKKGMDTCRGEGRSGFGELHGALTNEQLGFALEEQARRYILRSSIGKLRPRRRTGILFASPVGEPG